MARRHLQLGLGVGLIVVALVGFATVADDLRHVGGLSGVGAILLAGLALVAAARGVLARRLALAWLAPGALIGVTLGAAVDHAPAGLAIGLAAGLAVAYLRRPRTA